MPKPKFVTVRITQAGPTSAPVITPSEEPIDLDEMVHGHGNGAFINWDISNDSTPGWEFRNSGIVINDLGRRKFTDKGQSNPGKRHTWQREEADRNTYKYTIHVTDGKTTAESDPFIRNF
jgi:hypothetical protein